MKTLFPLISALATSLHAAVVAPSVSNLPPVAATFKVPARVATDQAGNVFVVDSAAGRVVVMDAFNRFVSEKTGLRTPLGIAVDSAGNIYLGEADSGSVSVFDSQWNLLSKLGAGDGEFGNPAHVAVDAGTTPATVYVSDSAVNALKIYRAGVGIGTLGGPDSGSARFNVPAGVWVSPAGDVFAVDQGNERVLVYNRSGVFLHAMNLASAYAFGPSGRPQGIAGDAQGRLYVTDTFQDQVKVFDFQGAALATFSGYGKAAGQLQSPAGLALDSQGRLYVASPNTTRVEVFGLDCFMNLRATTSSRIVATGTTVHLSVNNDCAGLFTYQWRNGTNDLTDGAIISGATNATLTLTGVTTAEIGDYSVALTGPDGTVISPATHLTITPAPVITASPVSRTVAQGSTVTFTAAATGLGLTYRWFFNGIELLVPNTNALALTNVQPWASGKYWAVATNCAGLATTAQATLTVLTPPTIVTGPTNQTTVERGSASFSALGNGGAPLRYQWYRGASALANQTNATMLLTNLTPAWNGSYYARVSNAAGATNSPSATLTVIPDTIAPKALSAAGGAATSRTILVSFSKALSTTSAQQVSKYMLSGPGNLSVASAVVTNSSKVLLTLNANRSASGDYALRIQDVSDNSYSQNLISPNPVTLAVAVADSLGTKAWWPLDDATGTTALDASGNGFDGTLENTTWISGRSGSAVNLNGTTSDVLVPALNLYTNTVTVSAWVRRSGSQPGWSGIFFCRAGNSVAGLHFGTTNELRYTWNDASASYNFSSGLVPSDGQWAFVAMVVEPSRAILYLNTGGGFQSATNTTTHALEEFNATSYFGWDALDSNRRFKGALDDVRVCNRALSAGELQALYTAAATPATCAMSAPANNSVVASATATLTASVNSNGNSISRVEFLSGNTILGSVRTPPYSFVWTNLTDGAYSAQARAYFSPANYTTTSAAVNFTVVVPITAAMQMVNGDLTLLWSGGHPPYQVQMATNLGGTNFWQDVGAPTTGGSMTVTPTNEAAFYRIIGQ